MVTRSNLSSVTRILFSIALAIGATSTIAACGNGVNVDIPAETEESQHVDEGSLLESTTDTQKDPRNYSEPEAVIGGHGQSFSEGFAWIEYVKRGSSRERYGCIDKEGNILYTFPEGYEIFCPSPFDNGYSFIIEYGDFDNPSVVSSNCQMIMVVDTEGNTKSFNAYELGDTSTADKEERSFQAFGGGYFVLSRHQKADFNKNDYPWIYEIYDADGNYIDFISSAETWSPYYCGQGVFEFRRNANVRESVLFFVDADKFIKMTPSTDVIFVDGEDAAYLTTGSEIEVFQAVGEGEWQNSTVSGMVFVTKDGEIFTHDLPDNAKPFGINPRVSNGKLVLRDENTIYALDIKTGMRTAMPEEYAERDLLNTDLIFHDDVCATTVTGADYNNYCCVYDSDWNRLFSPLEVSNAIIGDVFYSDGIMPIALESDGSESNSALINTKGEVVFTNSEGWFSQPIDGVVVHSEYAGLDGDVYSRGKASFTARSSDDVPIEYYDTEGKLLFDSLHLGKMKTLNFNIL